MIYSVPRVERVQNQKTHERKTGDKEKAKKPGAFQSLLSQLMVDAVKRTPK